MKAFVGTHGSGGNSRAGSEGRRDGHRREKEN